MNDIKIEEIEAAFKESGFNFPAEPFLKYLLLLQKWNKTYNLTAIRNMHDMLHLHIIDSLLTLPDIQGQNIVDVGTGAGLPGLMLALANPNFNVTLVESVGKKTNFLEEAKRLLNLKNVTIVNDRVEKFITKNKFDTIITRAFAPVPKMLKLTKHLVADNGVFLAMKGEVPQDELKAIDDEYSYTIKTYMLEKIAAKRSLIIIRKN